MEAKKYFDIMDETGKYTYDIISDYIKTIPEKDIRDFIFSFINGRLQNKRRLRSMLVRAVYHILTGDESNEGWKKVGNLCAFAELWCIADYLTNDTFDNKLDKCKTEISKDSHLFYMASAITREISQRVLEDSFNDFETPLEARLMALEEFSELVRDAYYHQWTDYATKYNGESVQELEERLDEIYKKRYEDYEAGNVFGKILSISALVIDPTKEEERKLLNEYSISSMQIVNDIADIAENCYDAKNKILTYPLLLTMIKTGKNVYELPPSEIRELFVKSGAFNEARKAAIKEMKKAKKVLKNLKENVGDNLGIQLLASFLIMAWSNKYYKILRAYEK